MGWFKHPGYNEPKSHQSKTPACKPTQTDLDYNVSAELGQGHFHIGTEGGANLIHIINPVISSFSGTFSVPFSQWHWNPYHPPLEINDNGRGLSAHKTICVENGAQKIIQLHFCYSHAYGIAMLLFGANYHCSGISWWDFTNHPPMQLLVGDAFNWPLATCHSFGYCICAFENKLIKIQTSLLTKQATHGYDIISRGFNLKSQETTRDIKNGLSGPCAGRLSLSGIFLWPF